MKFETLMLKSLFVVCVLAGVLTIGSMLLSKTGTSNIAATHVAASVEAQS